MHLLYCDETNLDPRHGQFLIYGGLLVPPGQAMEISRHIDAVRQRYGVVPEFRLKFNPKPDNMDHQQFIALKQELMEMLTASGCKLFAYVVLHDIASDADAARRNGINTVCFHFHCALNRVAGTGLVLIDKFNDEGNQIDSHLRDKFTTGLTGMPYRDIRLENIVGFHYSSIGQSHFPSMIDIALGSLRFAINAHCSQEHLPTARRLLELLSPMFWREEGQRDIPEIGFQFSPKVIKFSGYRDRYEALKRFLDECGVSTVQEITDQRRY